MTDNAGTRFETDVLRYMRERGNDVERLAKAGTKDEGDIRWSVDVDTTIVLELKVRRQKTNQLTLGSLISEAVVEAERYKRARRMPDSHQVIPAAVLKRPNRPIGDALVIFRLSDLAHDPDSADPRALRFLPSGS